MRAARLPEVSSSSSFKKNAKLRFFAFQLPLDCARKGRPAPRIIIAHS